MTDSIRLATFNVENLFARYRFRNGVDPTSDDGFSVNDMAFHRYQDPEKKITAQAIKEVNADIICLQEVESLPVLDNFNSRYLASMKYRHRLVIDGNDPRKIDVAVLSRLPISSVRTHRHERNASNSATLFSRDCLVVRIEVPVGGNERRWLTLYVNHFKSMMDGRDATHDRRKEQVERVAALVDADWAEVQHEGSFAVLGDFNDYIDAETSLGPLVDHPRLVDALAARPEADRWTHYWARGGEYRQIDFILLSKALFQSTGSPTAEIMRKGLPWRAERYDGERFEDVGERTPKASDHAAVYVDLPKSGLL